MSFNWNTNVSGGLYFAPGVSFRFESSQIFVQALEDSAANPNYISFSIRHQDFFVYLNQFPELQEMSSILVENFVGNVSGTGRDDFVLLTRNPLDPYGLTGHWARYNVDAGDGNDFIGFQDYANTSGAYGFINGGNGNDLVSGSTRGDTLLGGNGDDIVRGYGGEDLIDGGDGNDLVSVFEETIGYSNGYTGNGSASGGEGNDTIFGGGGRDYLFGDGGDDSIVGLNGDDALNGGSGTDYLSGDAGNDSLYGGDGADILIGGAGWDEVTGGAGADVFGFRADSQRDYITDFEIGVDNIRIDQSLASDFAALDAMTSFYNDGNWGIIEFADGQVIALWQTDMTQINSSWFQFGIV